MKLAEEKNKTIGLEIEKAISYYEKYGYKKLAKKFKEFQKEGYVVYRVPLFVGIADGDKPLSRLIPHKGLHEVKFVL
ncbi:MAG: hypothetical protein GXN97_00100, partial [Aquificae bacterium]|nr:hypothetical protein [Aquificota bacterium]